MKRLFPSFLFIVILWAALLVIAAPAAHAQSPYGLEAQVDTNEITTDETVTLTLTLTVPNGNAPRLNLSAPDGFTIVGSRTGSQYSVVNGTASASMRYMYELQPTRTGDLTISSLHLDLNGQTLSTQPITVHVTQGTGVPRPKQAQGSNAFGAGAFGGSAFGSLFGTSPFDDPFFNDPFSTDMFASNANLNIQAAANKSSVYVGEPVEYSVRVSSDAMLLGEPQYDAPKFTGFWAHQPPISQQGATASTITTLLFPTTAGELSIDPATIRADGGFFSNAIERQTEPVKIDVKPLPQGAPKEFSGAVGQFEIHATLDKTATRVGEPIIVNVEIRGSGNFDTLPDPKWTNDPNWRAFDAKGETKSDIQNGQLAGTKTFQRTMIPTKEGALTIPAIRYAYFDPSDEKYHVVETKPVQVNVAAGDPNLAQGQTGTTAPANAGTNAGASNVPALAPQRPVFTTQAKPLAGQPLFWGLLMIPLGIVAFDIGLGLRKRYRDANAAEIRAARALRQANRKLKRASETVSELLLQPPESANFGQKGPKRRIVLNSETVSQGGGNVSLAVANVVLQYLEDKTNRALLGVTHSALAQLLSAHGIPQELIEDVIVIVLAGETTEFGKLYGTSPEQTITDAGLVLNALEGAWRE